MIFHGFIFQRPLKVSEQTAELMSVSDHKWVSSRMVLCKSINFQEVPQNSITQPKSASLSKIWDHKTFQFPVAICWYSSTIHYEVSDTSIFITIK